MGIIKGNTWAIGGGKGGVGKSFISSNLACGLALKGYRVILVDADLGGANVHTLFGIRYPEYTLNDFLGGKVKRLHDILVPASTKNLYIICGASDFLELANPKYSQKEKLIKGISELNADYVLIDIGAGASYNNLDFFNTADAGIIVTSPTPTAIQNGYGFMKLALQRRLLGVFSGNAVIREFLASALNNRDKFRKMDDIINSVMEIDAEAGNAILGVIRENRYRLLVNMGTETEGEKVSRAMSGIAHQFLGITIPYIGTVGFSIDAERSIRKMSPLMLSDNIAVSNAIMNIVKRIILDADLNSTKEPAQNRNEELPANIPGVASAQLGLNEDVVYDNVKLHIQTEDLGMEKGKILTVVYRGGAILFSTTSDYESDGNAGIQRVVQEKVRKQHNTVVAGIRAGRLRDKIGER